jgi:hypothetical protein
LEALIKDDMVGSIARDWRRDPRDKAQLNKILLREIKGRMESRTGTRERREMERERQRQRERQRERELRGSSVERKHRRSSDNKIAANL